MAREFVTISRDIREYVPEDWRDSKGEPELNAFKVKFKPLSKRQLAQLSDSSSRLSLNSNTILLGNAVNSIDTLKLSLVGWDNYIVDGNQVAFAKDASGLVSDELLEAIWLDVIEEIASHIIKVSKFPESEAKK